MNIFTSDLSALTYADLTDFMRISLPIGQREREGWKLDYKREVKDDLAEIATAFANAFGGVIILGVEESNTDKGLPDKVIGIKRDCELKSKLTSMIHDAVRPVPTFAIQVLEIPANPGYEVAVVRIEEGDSPPYMWIKGKKNKIAVRVEADTPPADPQALEGLIARRTKSLQGENTLASFNRVPRIEMTAPGPDGRPRAVPDLMRIGVIPSRQFQRFLHRKHDESFKKQIEAAYSLSPEDVHFRLRGSDHVSFEYREDCRRIWTLSMTGEVGVVVRTTTATSKDIYLSHLAKETTRGLTLAKRVLEDLGWHGGCVLFHQLEVREGKLAPIPTRAKDSLRLPKTGPADVGNESLKVPASGTYDLSDIDDPAIVSQLLVIHFRELYHADADLDGLTEFVKKPD